jgi:two-component system NtrC family sensor kinase
MSRRPGLWAAIGVNLALLTVAVSLLDAGVFFLVTRGVLSNAAADLAVSTAEVVAAQLSAVDEEQWKRVLEVHRRAGNRQMTLYGPSGAVIAGDAVEAGPEVRAVFFSRESATDEVDGGVQVVAPVGGPGPPSAVLRLRLPITAASAPAWALIAAHAVFSAVLIVVFGITLFRGSLLRPIDRLREGTRRIAAGELGLQLADDAPAELAELADALNQMSTALADYRTRTADQLRRLEAANEELRTTRDALIQSEKLASVGRLAAGLAHELGNPLTAVRGYIELLAMGGTEGSDELVLRCQREVERMHRILRSTLDFARQAEPQVVSIDARAMLEEAARTVEDQGPFRTITVRVEVDGAPVLRGEPAQLHQVLVNLLLNAADAGARTILLGATQRDGDVLLRCEDDGEGIAAENMDRLFEPFFTTRPPGKGTGLGLAVSNRIVEQHGGRFDVSSVAGQGARFVIRLPAARGGDLTD